MNLLFLQVIWCEKNWENQFLNVSDTFYNKYGKNLVKTFFLSNKIEFTDFLSNSRDSTVLEITEIHSAHAHFGQKVCESDGFTKEIIKQLI